MLTFSHTQLEQAGVAVLRAVSTPDDLAQLVSHSLVESNLVGHDSHGVMRLVSYASWAQKGKVIPDARCEVSQTSGAVAIVDGKWGWGQATAQLATRTVVELAQGFGVGAVALARCHHIGRLGEYVDAMARAGCVGIAHVNAGSGVAPFGGRTRMLGTNPIAYGAPGGPNREPILVDMATSGVAEGKIQVARAKGDALAPGLIVDKDGNPSTQPDALYEGGAMLPFGGHKGFSLSVMCELLGGVLSGAGASSLPEYQGGNGVLFIAMNVGAFVPPDRFADQTARFADVIRAAPRAPGVSEILMPGDPEWRARAHRLANGIPVPENTWRDIQALAQELGVSV